jgi:hypothetical protein
MKWKAGLQPSEVIDLLCNGGKGFSDGKIEKSSKNAAQTCVGVHSDFKPNCYITMAKCSSKPRNIINTPKWGVAI